MIKQSNNWIGHLETVPKQWSKIGSGIQSIAYTHKNNPNTIIKNIIITGTNDPAYQFTRLALNHQDNPHFPRIYSAKLYNKTPIEDEESGELNHYYKYHLMLTMEKLYNILNTDKEFIEQIFGIPIISSFILERDFTSPQVRLLIRQKTQYPKLAQAMKLMEPLFIHYGSDVNFRNLMYRRTSVGPQLVFLDPIYWKN